MSLILTSNAPWNEIWLLPPLCPPGRLSSGEKSRTALLSFSPPFKPSWFAFLKICESVRKLMFAALHHSLVSFHWFSQLLFWLVALLNREKQWTFLLWWILRTWWFTRRSRPPFLIGWWSLHTIPAHHANKPIRTDEPNKGLVTINIKKTKLQYLKRVSLKEISNKKSLMLIIDCFFRGFLSWINKLFIFVKSYDNMQKVSDFSHYNWIIVKMSILICYLFACYHSLLSFPLFSLFFSFILTSRGTRGFSHSNSPPE